MIRIRPIMGDMETMLDEADKNAESTDVRLSHDEVFGSIRMRLNEEEYNSAE